MSAGGAGSSSPAPALAPVAAGTAGRDPGLGTEHAARRAIVECCLRMSALGLNPGRSGNVSLRWHRGGPRGDGMLVTPAATPYETMNEDDIVWMALDADAEADLTPADPAALAAAATGNSAARVPTTTGDSAGASDVAGFPPQHRPVQRRAPRPSSEWRMHRDVYRARPEAGAVVHAHSPSATALACLPRVQATGIPAFHYMVAVAGGPDIRCAPYRTFGTAELSAAAIDALRGRRACLLANHGSLAFGATLADALELSGELESLARMYAQALQIGEPVLLDEVEIERVLKRFADYRQAG